MKNAIQITKRCPECGREMVTKQNRKTGESFIGCTGFPGYCDHTEPIPESIKLRQAGHKPLPGFE